MSDPKIAVLIPVYNEEPVFKGTITALRSADMDLRDIYVVDDRSTDNTAEIARSLGVNVFTVEKNGGKAAAQRAALKHFDLLNRYDWVIFLDGDTKVEPYFINAMYKAAKEDPSVALYVGQVTSANNDHIYAAARTYEYTFSHDITKIGQDNFNVVYVAPGCTSMYRTDVLSKMEIDSQTLAEDMDLTIQVHRLGEKVKYVHDARVVTQDPNNFKDYSKQVVRWFRGFWQVMRKHEVFSFKKKSRVDLYMLYIALDSLLFNRVFLVAFGFLTLPANMVLAGMLIDYLVFIGIGGIIALKTKRPQVFYKAPAFYLLSYVNLYALLRSFVEIILLNKELLTWNKVKRYDFQGATK
jgi:cellulose synthase/poly-beta-1,6-N-acetylglucosamine synthase-like glycosyltransferase